MKCTFFLFEGAFRDDDPENAGMGLFSSALVPCSDEDRAFNILENELNAYNIDLLNIEEKFLFDPEKFDLEDKDPENMRFVSLYEEVKKFNTTIFTPWHVFQAEDEGA